MIKKILKIIGWTLFILFFLFCTLPYLFSVEKRELAANEKPYPNSYFITVNKTRIHYRVWKPDTINHQFFFVHGFSGSTFCFRHNIDTLVKSKCLVVAIDLPAFGFSDKGDTADYRLENVFEIINQLGNQYGDKKLKWNMVGHSMGAAVSGTYASQFPEKINSLTLIDGAPFHADKAVGFGSAFLKFPPLLRWADVGAKYMANPHSFSELLSSAYACKADTEAVNGYMKPFFYEHSGSAIFRMAAAQSAIDVNEENLQKVKTHIIWGDKDAWLPILGMRNFMRKYPAAKGTVVRGGGHCTMETHPGIVNAILLQQVAE